MAYSIVQTTGFTAGPGATSLTTPVFPGNTTPGNIIVCAALINRYDASPTVDAAPTASRSGGETFTRLGFSADSLFGNGWQMHVLAAVVTEAATTAVGVSETLGDNCDASSVVAFEVSGLATVGSLYLAGSIDAVSSPGTGVHSSPALGTLSAAPAMLVAFGGDEATTAADTGAGYASIATLGTASISHRRLTATTSVSPSVSVTADGNAYIGGFALLEGSGSSFQAAWAAGSNQVLMG